VDVPDALTAEVATAIADAFQDAHALLAALTAGTATADVAAQLNVVRGRLVTLDGLLSYVDQTSRM
jgi:hypothetical protein